MTTPSSTEYPRVLRDRWSLYTVLTESDQCTWKQGLGAEMAGLSSLNTGGLLLQCLQKAGLVLYVHVQDIPDSRSRARTHTHSRHYSILHGVRPRAVSLSRRRIPLTANHSAKQSILKMDWRNNSLCLCEIQLFAAVAGKATNSGHGS